MIFLPCHPHQQALKLPTAESLFARSIRNQQALQTNFRTLLSFPFVVIKRITKLEAVKLWPARSTLWSISNGKIFQRHFSHALPIKASDTNGNQCLHFRDNHTQPAKAPSSLKSPTADIYPPRAIHSLLILLDICFCDSYLTNQPHFCTTYLYFLTCCRCQTFWLQRHRRPPRPRRFAQTCLP